jgi:hypothetical protein
MGRQSAMKAISVARYWSSPIKSATSSQRQALRLSLLQRSRALLHINQSELIFGFYFGQELLLHWIGCATACTVRLVPRAQDVRRCSHP